jgi:hypothetical protein
MTMRTMVASLHEVIPTHQGYPTFDISASSMHLKSPASSITTNKEPSRNSVTRFNRAVKQPHKVTPHLTAFSDYTIRTIFFILHLGLWSVRLDGISLETSILYQHISSYFVIVHGLLTTWNLLRARGPSVRYPVQINLPLSNPPSRS